MRCTHGEGDHHICICVFTPYLYLCFQTVFVYLFSDCICICVSDYMCVCVCKLYLYFNMYFQWCQSKKSKTGCPGIPQFKYTRSSTGFPCYWDPKRLFTTFTTTITTTIILLILSLECAWCVTNMVQCKDGSTSDPKKCGRHCKPAKDQKCDGVRLSFQNHHTPPPSLPPPHHRHHHCYHHHHYCFCSGEDNL